MRPRLLALKTAVPSHVIAQSQAARYAQSLFAEVRDIARLMPIFENTGIAQRYSCVPIDWYLGEHGWLDRTELYIANAVALLETVSHRLLEEAGLKPCDIDAIVTVSSGLMPIGLQSSSEAQIANEALRPLSAVVRSARLAAVSAILHSAWR